MIKISVDEAYAFDYLSIIEIKARINKTINTQTTKNDIIDSIGIDKYNEVIESLEYKDLKSANLVVFEAVDMAKKFQIPASYVDYCNYQRMICKRKLQDKHFNNELTEVKIGYNV